MIAKLAMLKPNTIQSVVSYSDTVCKVAAVVILVVLTTLVDVTSSLTRLSVRSINIINY